MDDGRHIWVQLLDRPQKLLKVVVIALESFTFDRDKAPLPYVLWEEHTEVWINVSLCLHERKALKVVLPAAPSK